MRKSKYTSIIENYLKSDQVDSDVLQCLITADAEQSCLTAKSKVEVKEREFELERKAFELEMLKTNHHRKAISKNKEVAYLLAMQKLQSCDTNIETKNVISVNDFDGVKLAVSPTSKEVDGLSRSLANKHGFVIEVKHDYTSQESKVTVYMSVKHVDGHCETFKGSLVIDLSNNSMSAAQSSAMAVILKKLQMQAFGITFTAHDTVDVEVGEDDGGLIAPDVADSVIKGYDKDESPAVVNKFVSGEQVESINSLIKASSLKTNSVINKMRLAFKIRDINKIEVKYYAEVIEMIKEMAVEKQAMTKEKNALKTNASS